METIILPGCNIVLFFEGSARRSFLRKEIAFVLVVKVCQLIVAECDSINGLATVELIHTQEDKNKYLYAYYNMDREPVSFEVFLEKINGEKISGFFI